MHILRNYEQNLNAICADLLLLRTGRCGNLPPPRHMPAKDANAKAEQQIADTRKPHWSARGTDADDVPKDREPRGSIREAICVHLSLRKLRKPSPRLSKERRGYRHATAVADDHEKIEQRSRKRKQRPNRPPDVENQKQKQ